jgi:phosphate uptake regulator
MGLEIVDEQATAITLQDFLDPKEFHVEKAVRRMGILAQAMQEEAMAALKEPKPDLQRSSEDRDDEVDRLFWLVNKQYHAVLRDANYAAKLGVNANQGLNFLLTARLIERTADHADRIVHEALLLPPGKIPEGFLGRLEKQGRRSIELFQLALQTFFKHDAKKANAIIEETEKFQDSQKKLLRETTEMGAETSSHLAYIMESIGRTAAYAADVGEVAINHSVAMQGK